MTEATTAARPIETSATAIDTSKIIGWGVDADPDNDPTYPYRDRSNDDHSGEWQRPVRQRFGVEVLQSVEHKRRPAVFGTSTPPSWISGMLRRWAFRWSESNWVHWLMLLGADRINVVEGVVQNLGRGKFPNIPAEMGVPAVWKHNKKGAADDHRGHRRRYRLSRRARALAQGLALLSPTQFGRNRGRLRRL